jgi:hypothetical protein
VTAGTFDAPWFEVAIVFFVTVSLAIGTLRYVPFVLRGFKFDFALV